MITYNHADAETRFLYERAGFAAYSAYRAFELEVDERFDDAKQEAASPSGTCTARTRARSMPSWVPSTQR